MTTKETTGVRAFGPLSVKQATYMTVRCPRCNARPGTYCQRPGGSVALVVHVARRDAYWSAARTATPTDAGGGL